MPTEEMYSYATLATLGDDVYFEPSTAFVTFSVPLHQEPNILLLLKSFRGACGQSNREGGRTFLIFWDYVKPDCPEDSLAAASLLRSVRSQSSHPQVSCMTFDRAIRFNTSPDMRQAVLHSTLAQL